MDTGISQGAGRSTLIGRLRQQWQRRQIRWLDRRVLAMSALQLGRRTIFIMPTPQGALIGIAALAISLIALAERNVTGVLLASLILSLFLVCLILSYRNLSGLRVKSAAINRRYSLHCFEGEQARFLVQLDPATSKRRHQQLRIGFDATSSQYLPMIMGLGSVVELQQLAVQRGVMSAPRLLITSDYPLGLWRAWSRPDLTLQCLVYPQPVMCRVPDDFYHRQVSHTGAFRSALLQGNDDFAGLREYQQGDTVRQIHWQSLARGQGLQTRQFVREQQPELILDWDMYAGRDTELILGCLCYQILQFSRRQMPVGLRLPGTFEAPGNGDAHKHRLLTALAMYAAEPTMTKGAVS